ncbi:MAG: hypothetical protein M3467_10715 [Actinomycetota bacterium]|nr:hypothetical protein [Actinomycetota bacterium]
MLITGLILLTTVIAAAALAVCSAHIPVLRDWTGAAPLEREQCADDTAVWRECTGDCAHTTTRHTPGPDMTVTCHDCDNTRTEDDQ